MDVEGGTVKVYAAMIGLCYEGYEWPVGIFSTKKKAAAACRKRARGKIGQPYYLEVLEYELDSVENPVATNLLRNQ